MEKSKSQPFRPIIFVSGKGGVGKSVICASLADHLSKSGKKVLLVELGEQSFYEKFFQLNESHKHIEFEPKEIKPNFFVSIWDFKAVLKEYVSFYIKSEKLYDLFFGNQMMQKLIQTAPALKELAILGKATSGPRKVGPKLVYDHIIIDSYSTGHHRALLKAPKGISQVIRRGPMGVQSESIMKVLEDKNLCQQIIVIKPEDLPTVEGLELKKNLESELGLDSTIVCNQILKFPLTPEELEEESEVPSEPHREFADYFYKIYQEQKICLDQLSATDPNYIRIPFCFNNANKFEFIEALGKNFENREYK